MSQDSSLTEMRAATLVDAAIRDRMLFKKIGAELDAMQPNEQAAKYLMSAFCRNQCEPWLTAYLLGCIGHPVGYETAKHILLSNAGSSAASYAGVAMAKMLGISAYSDLRDIVNGNYPRKIRRGAVCGMAATSSPHLLDDLFAAFKQGKLSRNAVSHQLAKCNPTDDWLLSLIGNDYVEHQKLACAIIEWMASPNSTYRNPGREVADFVRKLLSDTAFSINPRRREMLLKWINAT